MKSKFVPLLALALSSTLASGSILVQELFDDISNGNATLNGAGDTATSVGMTGTWATNGSTGIYTANNFNVEGSTLPGLPASGGVNGGIWNNTGSYNTNIYATRPLATPIDFGVDRVIYFSVRLNNPGDTSMGIGLASGSGPTDQFIGAGFTWNNAVPLGGGGNIAGNSAFISYGVLDGATENGVYGIRTYEGQNSVNTYGLLVGRITINATGDDVIHIKRYPQNAVIDNDLNAIIWSSTTTVDSSMIANRLLLWMNGGGSGELDAIRIGDTWTDVTGVTLAGTGQPALSGASVASITGTSAQASVNLFNSAADVTVNWDTVDQGTGPWAGSNALGNQPIGPITGASITGLSPDKVYFYRFHAVNTGANPNLEAWSETGTSFTTALTGLAVTGLDSLAFSPLEVDLYWDDNFETETGFIIERSPAGANIWATVGTAPANTPYATDMFSGLAPDTSYDYRVIATNAAGNSAPSNVSSVTTPAATALETKLLVNFDGTLNGTVYAPAQNEIDVTGSFKANGVPNVNGGVATLNPGNEGGPDGFDIDPTSLGDLRTQNWVAETLMSYQSTSAQVEASVVIDVQGDCNLRLQNQEYPGMLQMFYWNGSSGQQRLTTLPSNGVKVHLALAWNASTATLTGYINGVAFDSASGGAFSTPDFSTLSFGYFGRTGFEGRGIDGVIDAVAFQAGTGMFNPATDFLILPETESFASWVSGFPVGGQIGFNQDPDQDGLSNGIEAFFGTNPSTASIGITQVSTNGTVTTFTHPQASTPLSDVNGSYEWSLNLVDWYAGNGVDGPGGGPTVNIPLVGPVGGISTVTATASQPLGTIFIRAVANQ